MRKNCSKLSVILFSIFVIFTSFITVGCVDWSAVVGDIEPPQNLRIEQVYSNAIAISWTGNSSYYGYVVYVSESANISSAQKIDVDTNTAVAISGLDALTTYYFWVAGTAHGEIGNPSEMVSAKTLVGGPTEAKVEFSVNDLIVYFNGGEGATGYNIYYNSDSFMNLNQKKSVDSSDLNVKNGKYYCKISNVAADNGMYFVWVTGTAQGTESSNFASAFARNGIPQYQFGMQNLSSSGNYPISAEGSNATLVKINLSEGNISDSKSGKVSSSVEENSLFNYPVYYLNGTKLPRGLIVDENDIADSSKVIRLEHKPSKDFSIDISNLTMKKTSRGLEARGYNDFDSYTVGETHKFWIDETNSYGRTTFKQINATLKVEGKYGYIWVADSNFNSYSSSDSDNELNQSQLQTLSDTFDRMYQAETAIFGKTYKDQLDEIPLYEDVIDPKEKISILLFDISGDYSQNQNGGILGYFWSKDMILNEYTDTSKNGNIKSNEEEIFYMDVHFLDKFPNLALGTLVHEFQHMLHFVNKLLKNGIVTDTWYNEMFSMLTEDLFSKELKVNLHELIDVYVKSFMTGYTTKGLTSWNDDNLSYGYSYLLGAFVARNFGVETIREMALNEYANIESIVQAIQTVTGDYYTEEDLFRDFTRALCYPEGMLGANKSNAAIYGVLHFDKEVDTNIRAIDSSTNISFSIYLEPIIFSDYSFVAQDSSGQIFTIIGPYQYPRNNQYNQANVIYGKGFALQGLGVFNSTKTVKYTKPSNSDIKEYLIVQ